MPKDRPALARPSVAPIALFGFGQPSFVAEFRTANDRFYMNITWL